MHSQMIQSVRNSQLDLKMQFGKVYLITCLKYSICISVTVLYQNIHKYQAEHRLFYFLNFFISTEIIYHANLRSRRGIKWEYSRPSSIRVSLKEQDCPFFTKITVSTSLKIWYAWSIHFPWQNFVVFLQKLSCNNTTHYYKQLFLTLQHCM